MTSPISTNGLVAGEQPVAAEPGLRLVFFGLSIVSDWKNPAATSHRALLRALAAHGHQVVFLEERRNAPTVGLLKQRSSGPVKAFDRRYPDIPYRTYDLPPMREMDVWLGREASTADALVVFDGTPEPCVEGLERLDAGHALKLFEREVEPLDSVHQSALWVAASDGPSLPYTPVVSVDQEHQGERDIDLLIVVYDDAEPAMTAAKMLPEATLLNAGSALVPGAPFVSEVELADWYERANVTVVVDRPGVPVRALLPLASGSGSVLVTSHRIEAENWPFITSTIEQLPAPLQQVRGGATGAVDLEPWAAEQRATDLEALVLDHHQR